MLIKLQTFPDSCSFIFKFLKINYKNICYQKRVSLQFIQYNNNNYVYL